MKKNKTVSSILGFSGLWLAIISVFMCFGAGASFNGIGGSNPSIGTIGIRFFDYIFQTGLAKLAATELLKITPKYFVVWDVCFALLLLAIIALVVKFSLKLAGKQNATLDFALSIFAISGVVLFAVAAFMTKFLVLADFPATSTEVPEGVLEALRNGAKLGAGAICAGTFSILSAGCVLGSILTNPNK